MNKQTASKEEFFIHGLMSRYTDGPEFFEGLNCAFKSGTKTFEFTAESSEGKFSFIFLGKKNLLTSDELIAFIVAMIPDYDSMVLTYNERGKGYIVEADEKRVTTKTGDAVKTVKSDSVVAGNAAGLGNREYFINPDKAAPVLSVLGILGKNGKIRNDMIRKYNQIDHYVEVLDSMLRELAETTDCIRVIDMGCGKSYLDFVLNYYIKEVLGKKCYFTGIDINPVVVEDSRKMAAELKYNNMKFIEGDIADFIPDEKYDMLLTLHACDTATDKALSFAIVNDVKSIVCVPCCHKEMNSQYHLDGFEDVLKYGVLKARIADSLTDGMRGMYLEAMGYDVSMVEYISPLDTPKNLMMRYILHREKDIAALNKFFALEKMIGTDLSIKK